MNGVFGVRINVEVRYAAICCLHVHWQALASDVEAGLYDDEDVGGPWQVVAREIVIHGEIGKSDIEHLLFY